MLVRPGSFMARRRRASAGGPPVGGPINAPFASVQGNAWRSAWPSAPAGPVLEQPFTVRRAGFAADGSATTYDEVLYATKRLRLPYPNASTLIDEYAVSDWIFPGDQLFGGAVNNSTLACPQAIGRWTVIDQTIVGNSLRVAAAGAHISARAGQQIRAIRFRVTDGTTTLTHTVATPTLASGPLWAYPVPEFAHTFDITALSGDITVNAELFPWFGRTADGSVYDTATQTSYWLMRPLRYRKNVARATNPPIAVVNRDGAKTINGKSYGVGSAAGVVSTDPDVARATPYSTINEAYAGLIAATATTGGVLDGCHIYVASDITAAAATHPFNSGSDRACNGYALTIERDPNIASVTVENLSGDFRLAGPLAPGLDSVRVHLRNLTSTGAGGNKLRNRSTTGLPPLDIALIGCTANLGAFGGDLRGGSSLRGIWFWGGTYTGVGSAMQATSLGANLYYGVTATVVDKGVNRPLSLHTTVGCRFNGFTTLSFDSGRGGSSGTFIYHSAFFDNFRANTVLIAISGGDVDGYAFVNCLLEHSGGGERAVRISGDSDGSSTRNIIIHNITSASTPGSSPTGGWNNAYADQTGGPYRSHLLWSVKNCILGPMPSKGDGFANDPLQVGNWPYSNGVGHRHNWSFSRTGFSKEYFGINSFQAAVVGDFADPLWVNQQVLVGGSSGPGYGDYRLQSGSPVKNWNPDPLTSHDLDGNPRPIGADSCGAYV